MIDSSIKSRHIETYSTSSIMIRNSRTPTFLLIAMLIVIVVLLYNYWTVLEKNEILKVNLYKSEEKLLTLNEKKINVEKENNVNSDRIKYFQNRVDALTQSVKKKDTEIDELNQQVKEKKEELEKSQTELNEQKDRYEALKYEKDEEINELKATHEKEVIQFKFNITLLAKELE